MNLQITYSYERQYLPTNRHRKPRTMMVEATSSFPVRELSEKEFPLAFEVENFRSVYSKKSYDNSKSVFKVFKEEIRTDGRRLYKPMRYAAGAAISTEFLSMQEIEANISRGFRKHHYEVDQPITEKSVICTDAKAETVREIEVTVDKIKFSNGHFWKECQEPMYLVLRFGVGHNRGGTGFFVDEFYNSNICHENYFTALQREEAIAHALAVARQRGDTESLKGLSDPTPNIIVHMPEMVRRNPALDHGDGNPFLNKLYAMTQIADSAFEAECLVMAVTAQKLKH